MMSNRALTSSKAVPEIVIPQKCKAAVVINEGENFTLEIQDVDVPEPGPGELLLKLNVTGLCMSDIHFMQHDWKDPPMSHFGTTSPGHEGAGVVVKVGANVKNWKVGDRGGVKPLWDVCGQCELCWDGLENYCPKVVSTGLHVNGTYQQYITSPAKYTSPIPDQVPDHIAAPIMCSASTMHRSLTESGLKAGDFAVFPGGAGGVGIQGVQIARAMGMRPIVIDGGNEKRNLSMRLGAEAFVDFRTEPDVVAEVKRLCGGVGAHAVFVIAPQAYADAIRYIGDRIGGKVMCVGLPSVGSAFIGAEPYQFIDRNLHIIGTIVGTMKDTAASLEYARRGLLQQICEVRPLSKLPESVQQLRRGEIAGRIVIDFNQQ